MSPTTSSTAKSSTAAATAATARLPIRVSGPARITTALPITQPALSTTAATASARLTVARSPFHSSAAA